MKASAKVQIQMGLLSITNVKMYSAIDSGEKVSFNQLHCDCHGRVKQKYFCPACNKDIMDKTAELVKGYEVSKDNFLIISQPEIDSCKKESNEIIKALQFVEENEIPEIYFESASFLGVEKEGIDTFSLFYSLLKQMGKAALAKMVLRQKEHFLALKPYNGVLVAYDLHFPAEIRDTKEIEKPVTEGFDQETVDLARELVKKMCKPFNPAEIKDEYLEAMRQIITTKQMGGQIEIKEVKQERKVVSLKDALKGSLAKAA